MLFGKVCTQLEKYGLCLGDASTILDKRFLMLNDVEGQILWKFTAVHLDRKSLLVLRNFSFFREHLSLKSFPQVSFGIAVANLVRYSQHETLSLTLKEIL
ncbi:hypothetical protein STEG23_009188 [Scotinomys teguina]